MINKDETAQADQVTVAYAYGSPTAKKDGGWGCRIISRSSQGETIIDKNGYIEAVTTSSRASLEAALNAIEATPKEFPLVVYTNSTYTNDTCNIYIPKWKANGWINANSKKEPLNLDLLKRLDAAMAGRVIKFKYLKKERSGVHGKYACKLSEMAAKGEVDQPDLFTVSA